MENGGIVGISSSDTQTISAEEQDPNIAEDVEEQNPNLEEDRVEENPNLAEEENPNLTENMNGLNLTVGNSGNVVLVVSTRGDDFQVAKRISGKGEGRGKDVMETQALNADAATGCPICMEPWTSDGPHRISCLPCGHLFGCSCIKRWIQQGGKRISNCPQCNKKCKLSEIRILYVPHVAVVDGEMQQALTLLRAENEKLKLENRSLIEEKHQRMEEKAYYHEREVCEPLSKRRLIHLGKGEMILKPSLNLTGQLHDLQGLEVGNSSSGNLQLPSTNAASHHQMAATAKYTKVWEGLLTGLRQGKTVPISKLEAYRNITSPEILTADWPASLQIIRLIAQDHINSRYYQGEAEFLIFRTLNPHGFLVQLAEKKLSAVIQLPNQTLLLSSADRPGRMLGMLFPVDTVVFKAQLPNQSHVQQQLQQQQHQQIQPQQPQGMASAIGQAFAQSQLPNQSRPQLLSQGQGLGMMPGAGSLS